MTQRWKPVVIGTAVAAQPSGGNPRASSLVRRVEQWSYGWALTTWSVYYTTWLNIALLLPAALLLVRFFISGGLPMLRMMGGSPDGQHHHPNA